MGQRLDKSWDTHIVNQHPCSISQIRSPARFKTDCPLLPHSSSTRMRLTRIIISRFELLIDSLAEDGRNSSSARRVNDLSNVDRFSHNSANYTSHGVNRQLKESYVIVQSDDMQAIVSQSFMQRCVKCGMR